MSARPPSSSRGAARRDTPRSRRGVDKIGIHLYEGGVSSTEVVLRRDGRVATITIDRVADQNRLTLEVLQALQRAVDALAADEDTQAVVLTGSGSEFFSMGILNPTVRASYTKPQILELVRTANRLYDALEALPQIVIAALNGAARAGRPSSRWPATSGWPRRT